MYDGHCLCFAVEHFPSGIEGLATTKPAVGIIPRIVDLVRRSSAT
jgi:hypothetical protein